MNQERIENIRKAFEQTTGQIPWGPEKKVFEWRECKTECALCPNFIRCVEGE